MTEHLDGPRRRCYILTSNGDWMDMTTAGESGGYVDVFVVDVNDDDDYFELAEQGIGQLVGRLIAVDGAPVLQQPKQG